jgi:hypothetical protein
MQANTFSAPKFAAILRLPPGRTLPCSLGALGIALVVHVTLLITVRDGQKSAKNPDAFAGAHSVEPEFSTGPTLLIQPRLEAPELRGIWQNLVDQSRAAAARGEVDAAIKLLEEAENQVPNQPAALAEVAIQLEKCEAPARAIALWERIHQFGTSAGVYFSAADAKLHLLHAKVSEGSSSDAANAAAPMNNGPLRFGKMLLKDYPGSTPSRRSFTLNVPVQRINDSKIEVRDVSVQVQFYDQMGNRMLERTNAAIRWKWASSPVDWLDEKIEFLEVEYRQTSGKHNGEDRRFFGYVASVYFKDKLIDSRAEPPRLGQQYPPSRILSRESVP